MTTTPDTAAAIAALTKALQDYDAPESETPWRFGDLIAAARTALAALSQPAPDGRAMTLRDAATVVARRRYTKERDAALFALDRLAEREMRGEPTPPALSEPEKPAEPSPWKCDTCEDAGTIEKCDWPGEHANRYQEPCPDCKPAEPAPASDGRTGSCAECERLARELEDMRAIDGPLMAKDAEIHDLTRERDAALARKQHSRDWYERRWELLRNTVLPRGSEAEKLACDIMANGKMMHDRRDPWAVLTLRAEAAEQDRDAARADQAAMARRELKLLHKRSWKNGVSDLDREIADRLAALPAEKPAEPHSKLRDLVQRFAAALLDKLMAAEAKYGHGDAWLADDWRGACVDRMREHIAKGDPRDVAAYCAFMWHHGWSTTGAEKPAEPAARPDMTVTVLRGPVSSATIIDEPAEKPAESDDGSDLLTAASVRGDVVHARLRESRTSLCGEANVYVVDDPFRAESPWSCKRCAKIAAKKMPRFIFEGNSTIATASERGTQPASPDGSTADAEARIAEWENRALGWVDAESDMMVEDGADLMRSLAADNAKAQAEVRQLRAALRIADQIIVGGEKPTGNEPEDVCQFVEVMVQLRAKLAESEKQIASDAIGTKNEQAARIAAHEKRGDEIAARLIAGEDAFAALGEYVRSTTHMLREFVERPMVVTRRTVTQTGEHFCETQCEERKTLADGKAKAEAALAREKAESDLNAELRDYMSQTLGPDGQQALMHGNHCGQVALIWLRIYAEKLAEAEACASNALALMRAKEAECAAAVKRRDTYRAERDAAIAAQNEAGDEVRDAAQQLLDWADDFQLTGEDSEPREAMRRALRDGGDRATARPRTRRERDEGSIPPYSAEERALLRAAIARIAADPG